MSRTQALQRAQEVLDCGALAATLARRVRYASESEEAQAAPVLRAYLEEEMTGSLAPLGFGCQLHENPAAPGLPFLLAERTESAGLPTVLMYAHGDVVRGQAA